MIPKILTHLLQRFPEPELEAQFRREESARNRLFVRRIALLSVVTYWAFGLGDGAIPAPDLEWIHLVRYFWITPGMLLLALCASTRKFEPYYQWLVPVFTTVVQGLGHATFSSKSSYHVTHTMLAADLLILICLYTAPRLLTSYAIVAGLAFTVLQIGAIYVYDTYLQNTLLEHAMHMGGVNVLGAFICHWREEAARTGFALRRDLAAARAQSEKRGAVMEKFLTHHVRSRFSPSLTLEENLVTFLVPRPARVALLQADVRGYAKLAESMASVEVVRLLQSYYKATVDAAQEVGQVKIIGDAIFIFIEEGANQDTRHGARSIADLALDLGVLLAREADRLNHLRGPRAPQVRFGIALHVGNVVVGNLSSETCIDYTVVGPEVNKVARLEELTKNPYVASIIGDNGILISDEAAAEITSASGVGLIDLAGQGIPVRSFPGVKRVRFLRSSAAEAAA